MTRVLDVYLHDKKAGQLVQARTGQLTFSYDVDYLGASRQAVSVSMPLREEAYSDSTARPYFSGLLPDERARNRLAAALGISAENAFGLLEVVGGECAGALSLVPEGRGLTVLGSTAPEPLDEKRLSDLLDLLRERPLLGGVEGVRLSLAGAQDKLAVCVIDGQITLPADGRPTTHILKPFIEGLDGTVENEVFCMRLAARMGLSAPAVEKASVAKADFILVERYDRIRDSRDVIHKLHQEDFCQALRIPPELKYEEEGGPGIAHCQTIIQQHTGRPAAGRLTFLNRVIYNYLAGNADAHGKNYSLLYKTPTPDLAPVYDVVCTAAYPRLAKNLAMKIGGRAIPDTIQWEHWRSLVPDTKVAHRLLANTLAEMAESIEREADSLLAEMTHENIYHPVLKTVRKTIAARASLIRRILESAV